jgi:plasmid stabilization system protein ParE
MSKNIIIEPEAEADLGEAYQWYERQRNGLGDDLVLCFEAAIEEIRDSPGSFPFVDRNTQRKLLRRFPYFVLYVELPEEISVLGVFHGRRDPKTWRSRTR